MDIKSIYDQVKLGGFQNPLEPAMNAAITKMTIPSLSEFTDLATTQAAANGTIVPSTEKLSTAFDSLENAVTKTNNMLIHSNVLSGVDKTGSMTITTIAALGNAAKTIEQFNGCEFSQSVLGAIQNATKIINDTTEVIENIDRFITNIPLYIDELIDAADHHATNMNNQIISDVEALAQAKVVVINNSIAGALVSLTDNECLSEIMASVMTKPLKDEVTKVTDKLNESKRNSIGG